jgi:hypothetical protein
MRKRDFAAILWLAPLLPGCVSLPDGRDASRPADISQKTPVSTVPGANLAAPARPWPAQPTPTGDAPRTTTTNGPTLGAPRPIGDEAVLIYQPASTDSSAPIDMLKRSGTPSDH